jgi:hypothetical protein
VLVAVDENEYTVHGLRSAAINCSAWFTFIVSHQVLECWTNNACERAIRLSCPTLVSIMLAIRSQPLRI